MIRWRQILSAPYSWLYGVYLLALGGLDQDRARRLAALFMPIVMLPFRSRLRSNLRRYWGDDSPHSKDNFASLEGSHLRHLALLTVAFARLPQISPDVLKRDVALEGDEHLREALKCGRGVLMVMDHLGNGWHILAGLSSRGYRITILVNTMPLPVLDRQIVNICSRFGIEVVRPQPDTFRKAGEVLKRNEIFLLAYDASIPSRNCIGIPFGRTLLQAHLGTALLAYRSHAPVLRVTNRVLPSGQSRTTIAPPLQLPSMAEPRADSASLLASWVRELDARTTLNPEQWCLWSYAALGETSGSGRNTGRSQPDGPS